ncbi:protein RER1-like isoform X2 [Biomphalaria glabrata]|uniref:Protein RER1 n=1 Tax=Biomphalaria glabrata TaxID=6526 RepID=A0A9W2YMG0_BIOGL|nr:protein RER1-like isoform X2 [Biomphalaria glabrata]KAI8795933.1 protein RER1 [Biomphalaria glabrata]
MESQKTAPAPPSLAYRVCKTILNRHQYYLDKTTPYTTVRWLFGVALFLFYTIRVYLLQGWYIVTYALGIYLLNLFIAFITPNTAGYGDTGDGDDGPSLPTTNSEEFRPFMRRLPEFKFWYSFSKAMVVAIICTYFDCINIPVFWPILVMYFVLLFTLTMKKQIKHMIKYRYIPFTYGKARYKGKEDTGKVITS